MHLAYIQDQKSQIYLLKQMGKGENYLSIKK